MGNVPFVSLVIFIMFLVAGSVICCWGQEVNATFGCISIERNALLKFKASFSDPYYRLSSWNSTNTDCCKWQGVKCDTITGHVNGLDLKNEMYGLSSSVNMLFSETLDSSIIELKHLSFLDLSGNDFQRGPIPVFIGSLNQLQHLNLSCANFSGVVPHHLGNLSRLRVLDLSLNYYYNLVSLLIVQTSVDRLLIVDDFMWVSRLSSLTHLDMSAVDISGTKDLLKVLNMLPYIVDLDLSNCGLENRNLQHACVINSTTLLPNIQFLDLSRNSFDGELPCFLENMTSLRDLDLSSNSYNSCNELHLIRLTNLVHLDLYANSFQCSANKISEFIPNNCNLESLNLGSNSFHGDISKFFLLNTSRCLNQKLTTLNLVDNHFYGQLPEEIGGFRKLEHLNLARNLISGPIPTSISNLSALTYLYLFSNKLNCSIPPSFGNLTSLKILYINSNTLSGEIPTSLGQLQNLETLVIDDNYFYGTISEAHFATLSKLQTLSVGNNLIKLRVKSDWTPPFQLGSLLLENCEISGGQFPKWLQTQKELEELSMRNCSISEPLPDWLRYKNMTTLDLSNNRIKGSLPDSLHEMTYLGYLYMSDNHIEGSLPHSLCEMSSMQVLDLSDNRIKGSLPHSLCEMSGLLSLDLSRNRISGNLPDCSWANLTKLSSLILSSNQLSGVIPNSIGGAYSLQWLQLSNNSITGKLPTSLRNCTDLNVLDLSRNRLSGNLPDCSWANLTRLYALLLSSNQFTGVIPNSIGGAYSLEVLQLSNNSFTGKLPTSLRNCTGLRVLDVGQNAISGKLPKWIGNYLLHLKFLRLRNNELYDTIPFELCQLSKLQLLDLANNKFTGNIPRCFGNLSDMVIHDSTLEDYMEFSLQVVMKGVELEYLQNEIYVVNMDLSNNALEGEIPLELMKLVSLKGLNLSYNHLEGMIPGRIGDMKSLESLDLSNNNLSGSIPESLSDLNFLSRLNLSYNNLAGEIPTGSQLQTLEDPWSYVGNSGLCGNPLPKKCHGNKATDTPNAMLTQTEDEDKADTIWFYGVVISGFATGFWGAIGVLVFKRGWRFVYFKFVEDIIARIFGR